MSFFKGMNPAQVLFDPLKLFIKDKEKKEPAPAPAPGTPFVDTYQQSRAQVSSGVPSSIVSGNGLGNVGG